MPELTPSPAFVEQVEHFYQLASPNPEFLSALRAELLQAPAPKPRLTLPHLKLRRPAWAVAFAILAILVTAIVAIGPQKVLAEVERLLGFVPGTGIVPVGTPLGLAEPYEHTHNGVTLRVEEFAPGIEQAALKLALQYPDQLSPVTDLMLDLSPDDVLLQCDNQPGMYPETTVQVEDLRQSIQALTTSGTNGPTYYSQSRTFAFRGLQPGAKRCTLRVAEMGFRIFQPSQKLHVEMGTNPHFGDSWPLDADLQVADQKIHVRGAQLVEKLSVDDKGRIPILELLVDPLPADSWVRLDYIYLEENASSSEPYVVDQETGQFLSGMILTPEQLQSGSADFVVDYMEGTFRGPWEVSWEQP